MKKLIILVLALTVPLLLALRVWQVHRYQELVREIEHLEQSQREWLERNKKLLAGIAVFRSPARIARLARELGLVADEKDPALRIEFPQAER